MCKFRPISHEEHEAREKFRLTPPSPIVTIVHEPSSEETPSNESEGEKLCNMVFVFGDNKRKLAEDKKGNACDIHIVDA